MNKEKLYILQHSLGGSKENQYRNYYCVDPGSPDHDRCEELVKDGLMFSGRAGWLGGLSVFHVTDEGRKAAFPAEESKLAEYDVSVPLYFLEAVRFSAETAGKARYKAWLLAVDAYPEIKYTDMRARLVKKPWRK